jgi:hypothetical protein
MGAYYLRANQTGGGAHAANCGSMTAAYAIGQGVGSAMCMHSWACNSILLSAQMKGCPALAENRT